MSSRIKSKDNIRIIHEDLDTIECPYCKESDVLASWENFTKSRCTSREMRRAYVSLKEQRATSKKTDAYFVCPHCERYVAGFKLRIRGMENV